jgi:hypothetical protein
MRVTGHPENRLLGYVQVKVASRVYSLPVEAAKLTDGDGSDKQVGFFSDGTEKFGILVDSDASHAVQKETIERASAEAAKHISRRLLN